MHILKKNILIFLLITIPVLSYSQTYDKPGNWGLQYKRLKVDTLFTVSPTAYALIGGVTLNTDYKLNVFGRSKLNSLIIDSFAYAPGSGDGGAASIIKRNWYYDATFKNFLNNSARGYRDNSIVTVYNSGAGYASFDSNPVLYADSVGQMDHLVSFQARPVWDYPATSVMNHLYGVWSQLTPKRGSVTNVYDFYAAHLGSTGTPATVTNHYGLFVQDFASSPTATNNWGVYVNGSNTRNYFAGNTGFGNTNPNNRVDVTGSARVSDTLKLSRLGVNSFITPVEDVNGRYLNLYSLGSTGGYNGGYSFYAGFNGGTPVQLLKMHRKGAIGVGDFGDVQLDASGKPSILIKSTQAAPEAHTGDVINVMVDAANRYTFANGKTFVPMVIGVGSTVNPYSDTSGSYAAFLGWREHPWTSGFASDLILGAKNDNRQPVNIVTVAGRNSAVGINVGEPTAFLHITAGRDTLAPLKLTAGTNLTSPQAGAIEYNGTAYYATNSTAVRGIIETNRTIVSAAATLTLDPTYSHYVFSGTTTTWTLPAVSGTINVKYYIKNRGSGAITLNTTAAANEIYNTAATNTLTVNAGEAYIVFSDGTYYNIE